MNKVAVVAGVGPGLGKSLCRALLADGYLVAGLSRSAEVDSALTDKYLPLACDLTDASSLEAAVGVVEQRLGPVSVYIHNAAYLLHKDFLDTNVAEFTDLWRVICLAAVNGIQRVLPSMLEQGEGSILVTGATASIKAGAGFSAFASAKFALRGLTQTLAREYAPRGIHVAHVLIDGAVWGWQAEKKFGLDQSSCLLPEDIAESYLHLLKQKRSAWTQELDLRPDIEPF